MTTATRMIIGTALAVIASQVSATPAKRPAGPVNPIATFRQTALPKKTITKALYYKNEDLLKTTSVTTKTPIYTSVQVPVYGTVQQPILDSKGKPTGKFKTVTVITGYTTQQKVTGYNSVVTKSTNITPKSSIFMTDGTTTTPTGTPGQFTFLSSALHKALKGQISGPQDAVITLSAVSTSPALVQDGQVSQLFDSGTLAFTRKTPVTRVSNNPLYRGPFSNLLTIQFTKLTLFATLGGTSFALNASSPLSSITMTSDFLNLTSPDRLVDYDFSIIGTAAKPTLTMAAVDPTLTNVTGKRTLNSFRASFNGDVSASDVPEPAQWAMMLGGFGFAGLRRRRAKAVLQA